MNKKLGLYLGVGAILGLALYHMRKKQSSLGGARMSIDTAKMVDSVSPWLRLNPVMKPLLGELAKDFLKARTGGTINL